MKEYELVFLDADDTLFDYRSAERYALTKAFNDHRITADEPLLSDYSQINKQLWLDYENNKVTQEELKIERFRRLFIKVGLDIDEPSFSNAYIRHLADASFLGNYAEELCAYLHGKYQIAIITNGISSVQRSRLDKSAIKRYIDYLIVSEEAKFSKPNVGIFTYAETITKFRDKNKMIIIGDSLSSDILGGINYGIDTCWLNGDSIGKTKNIQPTYVVNSLRSIKGIL